MSLIWVVLLLVLFIILLGFLARGPKQRCPHCRSWVAHKATVCPKCGRELA
jgi:predicted amidophosphoribosyltransferase